MSKQGKQNQTKGNVFASRVRHGGTNSMSQSRFASRRSDLSLSRRSVTMSEARLGEAKTAAGPRLGITVYDENGNDVTPRPLHTHEFGGPKGNFLGPENQSSTGTPTDVSFTSFYPNATATATASVYAQPFSRSIYGSTSGRSIRSKKSSLESSEEISESGPEITTGFGDVTTMRREEVEVPTEEELNKVVDITLEETDTIWMFDQKGVAVSAESEDSAMIKKKNDAYEELCKSKEGNDRFAERGMQTFNNAQKHKDIQAEKVNLVDVGVLVTTWDVYDTYTFGGVFTPNNARSDESLIKPGRPTITTTPADPMESEASANASTVTESHMSMMTSSVFADPEQEGKSAATQEPITVANIENGDNPYWEKISNGESIKQHLVVMERVVTENVYQPKQAAYRGFEILLDPDKESNEEANKGMTSPVIMSSIGPTLDRLWSYSCSLTNGHNVSSMAWNKANPDILAVGYGQFGFTEQSKPKGGLACCWNLKNPEYPERVYHCKTSVTAVDFSNANPNLLAVGQYDGSVYIYNVRNDVDQPVVDSFDCSGKHSAPIWQLCWIEREKGVGDDRGEILVSISADGRIVQWSIRKGFECTDLMKLKRVGSKNSQKKKDKSEAFISRQAPGMCFDFHQKDSNMYLAGTEEGLIHKCSCSYNEQFLDSYSGHTGSVYKIKWSPFAPDVFLSCSADWSIRLWLQTELKPVLNFFSTTKVVHDICWSPYSQSVFCAVNEGAVEIWDLNVNTLDPLILHLASPGFKFSCCLFSTNSNSVLIGDSDGQVSVYQLKNITVPVAKKNNSLMSLVESTLANQTSKTGEKE